MTVRLMTRQSLFFLMIVDVVVHSVAQSANNVQTNSRDELLLGDGSSTSNESCLDTSESANVESAPEPSCPAEKRKFYWYAIKLSSPAWAVLRHGDNYTEPFEKGIEKHCKGSQFFGFSFVAEETEVENLEGSMEAAETQMILTDVFYTCWGVNGILNGARELSGSESNEYVFMFLAEKLLEILPEEGEEEFYSKSKHDKRKNYCLDPNGIYEVKLPGVEACFFYLDTRSEGKAYGGVMAFNKVHLASHGTSRKVHGVDWFSLYEKEELCTNPDGDENSKGLKEGECIKYLDDKDFFLYCCCYHEPELCSFDPRSLRLVRKNLEAWRNDPVETKVFDGAVYTKWMPRHFMHSAVARIKDKSKPRSHRKIHCADGRYGFRRAHSWKTPSEVTNVRVNRIEYDLNNTFSEFCFKSYDFYFDYGYRNAPKEVNVSFGGDSAGNCSEEGCWLFLNSTNACFNDLIYLNNTRPYIFCCCNSGDLCNHRGKFEFSILEAMFACGSVTKSIIYRLLFWEKAETIVCSREFDYEKKKEIYLINGTSYYAPFSRRKGQYEKFDGCYRQEVLPFGNVGLNKGFPRVTLQFVQCECPVVWDNVEGKYISVDDGEAMCDRKFATFGSLPQEGIKKRPRCYSGELVQKNGVATGGFTIKETTDTPICVDEFTLYAEGSVSFISSTLTEYSRHQKIPSEKNVASISTLKRFMKEGSTSTKGGKIRILCQSNLTEICNGPKNFHRHLLPEFFGQKIESAKTPSKSTTRKCESTPESPDGNNLEVSCDRADGCFSLQSGIDEHIVGGCLSDLSSRSNLKAFQRVALLCNLNQEEEIICEDIEDVAETELHKPDTLCCCKHERRCTQSGFLEYLRLRDLEAKSLNHSQTPEDYSNFVVY